MERIDKLAIVGMTILSFLSSALGSVAWAQDASNRPGASRFRAAPGILGDVPSPPWDAGTPVVESRCCAGCCRDQASQLADESAAQPPTRQPAQPAPRDLRVLAGQLQVVTEAAADTIDYAVPCCCMGDRMRGEAAQVAKRARQFRKSVEQKVAVERLRRDFEAVADSFVALARPLQQQSESVLVNRAMIRVDRTLAEIGKTLAPRGPDSTGHRDMPGRMPHEHPSQSAASDSKAPHAHHQPDLSDSSAPLPLPTPLGAAAKPSVRRPVIPEGMEGIGQLPLEDQATALAQKTCPVTGGKLGAMGKPIKVDLGNRSVFVCCPGCVEELKKKASASPDHV